MSLNLIGKIELDGAGFERGLHRAGEHVTEFAKNAAVAAFGIYGVEEAIHKTVEEASQLVNTSKRLDVTIDELQVLQQAAKNTGSDLGAIAGAFEKINQAREKALSGTKDGMEILQAFQKLGVSSSQLNTMTAGQMFLGPLSKSAQSRSVEDIGPVLKEIMGKGFGELMPMLKEDFGELHDKMEKFGLLMDTETAVKLNHIGDEFSLLSRIMMVSLGPALVQFTEWLIDLVANSKVTEGLDFLARKTYELSKLGDFTDSSGVKHTAEQRATAGNYFAGLASQSAFHKQSFEDFINDHPVAFKGVFEDFKGTTLKEFNAYVKQLTQPVSDAIQAAAKGSTGDMTKLKQSLKEARENIDKEIWKIDHPTARQGTGGDDSEPKEKKVRMISTQSDALVKVGNFLGSNANAITRADQQKINLMTQQLNKLEAIDRKLAMNPMGGMGIPVV